MCFYVISHDEVLAQFDTLMKAMNYARFVPDECFVLNGLTGKTWYFIN